MTGEWIGCDEAASILNCSNELVESLVREGLLDVRIRAGQRTLKRSVIESLGAALNEELPTPRRAKASVEADMVGVSVALAGLAAAIAAITPIAVQVPVPVRISVVLFAGALAVYSAISSLWLLARYCCTVGTSSSKPGLIEIWSLLRDSTQGPYWFMALGLVAWLILSLLIVAYGAFSILR